MAYLTSQPISGDLLVLDGLTIPEITSYRVSENKLWKDATRNMNGAMRSTLIGVFPVIQLEFGYMNKGRMADIADILNQLTFGVTYFDPSTDSSKTLDFFAENFTMEIEDKERGLFKPTSVNLTSVTRK